MIKVTEGAFLAFFFIIHLSTVNSNIECRTISDEPYPVTAKDFKISQKYEKYFFCTAFFCSSPSELVKLSLDNYRHVKSYSTMVYSGTQTVSLNKDCSSCQVNSVYVKEGNFTCEACPSVPESRNIEIHIRIDKPSEAIITEDFCQFEEFFNITMYSLMKAKNKTVYCKDGSNVSLSINSGVCTVRSTSELQQVCLKPSCFDGIKFESISTGNFLHQFPQSANREVCIFNIKSDFRPVEIFYSPNIKDSLIVYGSSLKQPMWNLENCDDANSKVVIKPTGKSFYIVYKNEGPLKEKGSLSIIASQDNLCGNPPLLENGKSQVILENEVELLSFECHEGFVIVGSLKLRCDEALPDKIPNCISIVKNTRSDGNRQNVSNTTLLELDAGTTLSTVLLPISANTSAEENDNSEDYDAGSEFILSEYDEPSLNFTSFNASDDTDFELKLFNLPSFKENMLVFILIGVGFCLIIIATIVSAVVFRNKGSCRSNSGRKFDTFQNPIYEKPVQVPITTENGELCQEKIDLGDLSDSTVLE